MERPTAVRVGKLESCQQSRVTGSRSKHGVESKPVVKKVATVQKRRLLRQIGLRAGDLDTVALGYLDLWARVQSKV